MRGAMGEGIQLLGIDPFDGHAQLRGAIDDFLNLLLVRAVTDKDQFEAPLPRLQRGENRLAAFKVFHRFKAGPSGRRGIS